MTKLEQIIKILDISLGFIEESAIKKYYRRSLMAIRDVFIVNDPEKFTKEQLTELTELLEFVLGEEDITREKDIEIMNKILKMNLCVLPVTDYCQKKNK